MFRTLSKALQTRYLDFHPDVEQALKKGKPIVALESTIIAHGMPHPENLKTARAVEAIVREHGAMPATVALMGGRIKVGLKDEELEALATAKDVAKASRRDLAFVLASGGFGATTVTTTMMVAAMAGIRVFATGGIGGVHRGAAESFDISADLQELAATPVAVVCAGAKSILDLPKTLEYLETQGVPVIGYQTSEFPAFYSRESGLQVDYRMESAAEIAAALRMKWDLDPRGGALVAVPVPKEHALPFGKMEHIIADALKSAKDLGIRGKAVTPFLLEQVKERTNGESLATNIALVKNNAAVAAALATALIP